MHSWNLLELNKPEKIQLLASEFPNRADIYICDNCGRDVTKHFRARVSHSYPPYGPDRFVCVCGDTYLSGAIEWDNIGPRERRRRLVNLFGIFFVLFFVLGIFGLPIGLIFYF